uniref:Uncharacterized protein n=1 Tax=Anguilla anguilla TaxID=7936 RepID=A0A0E9U0D5_ANGAN
MAFTLTILHPPVVGSMRIYWLKNLPETQLNTVVLMS